jgi:hypothetical protein
MKRSYLLTEVLVALSLITLLFPLLLQTLTQIQREKRNQIENMELKAVAREAFCELKKELYRGISLDGDILQEARMGFAEPFTLGLNKTKWQGMASLAVKERYRKGEAGDYALLIDATIVLSRGNRKFTAVYPLTLMVGGKG